MSDLFSPVITEAGFAAALAASTGGFAVDVTHVAVGSSGYNGLCCTKPVEGVLPLSPEGLILRGGFEECQAR